MRLPSIQDEQPPGPKIIECDGLELEGEIAKLPPGSWISSMAMAGTARWKLTVWPTAPTPTINNPSNTSYGKP